MVGENRQKKSPGEHEAGQPADGATAILRLDLLRTYRLSWLPGDLLAGVVIFAVTIPTALAYGQLAGLQAVNGLYASLLAMAIYAFFGTSRQLIIDAEAAIAILVASSVAAVAGVGDPARFAALAMMEAVMVGGLLAMGGYSGSAFLPTSFPKPWSWVLSMALPSSLSWPSSAKLLALSSPSTIFSPGPGNFTRKCTRPINSPWPLGEPVFWV